MMSPGWDPQEAADLLRALAHPMRLAIVFRLLSGELTVSRFETELGLRQPSLSQQLGLLREAGLIAARREARAVYYCIEQHRIAVLINALSQYFGPAPVAERPRPALAPPPGRPVAPSLPGSECGVFATAGWNLPGAGNGGGTHV